MEPTPVDFIKSCAFAFVMGFITVVVMCGGKAPL